MNMAKMVDIFGIETDYAIEQEMEKRKLEAHRKRTEIIDGDILTYLRNYDMLDKMSYYGTKQEKKDFIVRYLECEIPKVRKEFDSRGKRYWAFEERYKNKPVDKEMLVKMADYIIDTYSHEDGVKYKRIDIDKREGSFTYVDKNGRDVMGTKAYNYNIYKEHLEKLIRETYPYGIKENAKYYDKEGKRV